MAPEKFIGKTLEELAGQTGVFWDPVRVFLLENENDDIGKVLMSGYTIRQIIVVAPAAAKATVVSACIHCKETILRVRINKEESRK